MIQKIQLNYKTLFETYGHTSKGNQLKWKHENCWIKADYAGYEGFSEVLISKLLMHSSINCSEIPFANYDSLIIEFDNKIMNGCISSNFLPEEKSIITLEQLYRKMTGNSLAKDLAKIANIQERVSYTVEFVERMTGLESFGKYISVMLAIDAFFLNEDRHTNNIAVIYNTKLNSYEFCPIFDNGMSLLSDTTTDYPLSDDSADSTFALMESVKGKPFSDSFDEALDAGEALYGSHFSFSLTRADFLDLAEKIINENLYEYDASIARRVMEILRQQSRKYSYMFIEK